MRSKIAWLVLSCVLVTAILLSSCGSATTTTTTTSAPTTTTTSTATTTSTVASTTTTTSAVVSTTTTTASTSTTGTVNPGSLSAPTYGGTLTLFISSGNQDPTGWDHMMTSDLGSGARWGNPYMEWLLTGDIAKYGLGPGANGAFAFNLYEGVPDILRRRSRLRMDCTINPGINLHLDNQTRYHVHGEYQYRYGAESIDRG